MNLLIMPTRLLVRESYSGRQTVPPHTNVLKISTKQASNTHDANCRTREDLEMPYVGANAVELETQLEWFMTATLGVLVVSDIIKAYAAIIRLIIS